MDTLRNQRVAVLGGAGFIGSHLVEHLVSLGNHVYVLTRGNSSLARLRHIEREYEFTACEIMDRKSLACALAAARPTAVFHLAGAPDATEGFAQMVHCMEQNAIGTVHVLEAASRAGAEIVVYADSSKVYGNGIVPYRTTQADEPVCSYAIAKAAGWRLCKLASSMTGIGVSALRPTFVYGPRQNWNLITYVEACARTGEPVRLQGGSQTRDLLFVGDVVRAFAAAAVMKQGWGRAIPVGGGREVSVRAICQIILDTLGSDVELQVDASAARMTEVWRSYCDNAEAERLLRWAPTTALDVGLRETLAGKKAITAGSSA
jgi:nucleoside-diphosphate-sugar epimerase